MATRQAKPLPGTTDRRIDALLTLLAENATIVISGAKIAKEIGVSRQQVFRWVEKLRTLGVRVKGHPRTGYHIERVPDSCPDCGSVSVARHGAGTERLEAGLPAGGRIHPGGPAHDARGGGLGGQRLHGALRRAGGHRSGG